VSCEPGGRGAGEKEEQAEQAEEEECQKLSACVRFACLPPPPPSPPPPSSSSCSYTDDDTVEELEVNCMTEENTSSWLSRLQVRLP
jgi:hypothetical protein